VPAIDSSNQLNFDNLPLSDVITVIQKVYNKRVELSNIQMGQKKFKANLYGLSFDRALQVICTTQNLTFAEKNGIYILKEK
jgi:transmembrane sensor